MNYSAFETTTTNSDHVYTEILNCSLIIGMQMKRIELIDCYAVH